MLEFSSPLFSSIQTTLRLYLGVGKGKERNPKKMEGERSEEKGWLTDSFSFPCLENVFPPKLSKLKDIKHLEEGGF